VFQRGLAQQYAMLQVQLEAAQAMAVEDVGELDRVVRLSDALSSVRAQLPRKGSADKVRITVNVIPGRPLRSQETGEILPFDQQDASGRAEMIRLDLPGVPDHLRKRPGGAPVEAVQADQTVPAVQAPSEAPSPPAAAVAASTQPLSNVIAFSVY
jgi:hypothetical protein